MSPGEFKSKWARCFRRQELPIWTGFTRGNADFLLRYPQIRHKPAGSDPDGPFFFNVQDIIQVIYQNNPSPEADKWLILLSTPTP